MIHNLKSLAINILSLRSKLINYLSSQHQHTNSPDISYMCYICLVGYMDGAVQAGERAAREVLFAMGKIAAEEIHQTEPPSQDVPPVPCQLTTFQSWLPTVLVFLTTVTAVAALAGGLSLRHLLK